MVVIAISETLQPVGSKKPTVQYLGFSLSSSCKSAHTPGLQKKASQGTTKPPLVCACATC